MNKTIDVNKNAGVLFIVNLIFLVGVIFFKNLYTKQEYLPILVNVVLVINIIILIIGIIFNVAFVRKPDKYNNKIYTFIIIIILIIYFLLNSVFMITVNEKLSSGYAKINGTLSSYCKSFECDKYETISTGMLEKFVIKKTYYDYDNIENELTITTTYNSKKVLSVEAVIYSRKQLFSQKLINDNLKVYFSNFNYEVKEDLIKEAFDKRLKSSVKDKNATYKVTEIYKENILDKLKTTITLDLAQE